MNAPATTTRGMTAGLPDAAPREGVKDTAESIVVAFILAFVFRAFIVEAFVIPTGSMAATLLGKHGTIACSNCGYEFDYGLADDPDKAEKVGAPFVRAGDPATCPNCRHANTRLKVSDEARNAESGDRILVLKWPYELGPAQLGPQRWDVTVFKDPSDGTTNFIKRLLGLPNEVLMIVDGDVFTAPTSVLSPQSLQTFDEYRRVKQRLQQAQDQRELWAGLSPQQRELFKRPMPDDILAELEKKLAIQTKSDEAQRSLWFNVYDHDFLPVEDEPGQPHWIPLDGAGSGWQASERRISFDGLGGRRGGLAFVRKPPAAPPIDDFYAYNLQRSNAFPVSDLRLSFVLDPQAGAGALWLKLSKRGAAFWARIAADGQVALFRTDGGPPENVEPLATARVMPFTDGRKRPIAFENVDYRVRLFVDDQPVLQTTPQQYAPNLRALRAALQPLRDAIFHHTSYPMDPRPPDETPRIFAEDMKLELWHLTLQRDVYYAPAAFAAVRSPISGWAAAGWGTDGNPILLAGGEYFMLGDNSPQSKDSRLWDVVGPHLREREGYQLGTVPYDQLIGRAFFVYWPAGLRPERLPFIGDFGIIPSVGRMRWIR